MLIFDETISGFRVALGGAAERFGVTPDLAVYGKAMAAGWPCAAFAGRRELFADVATGELTHAGTFNGNTMATAAVLASLDELEDRSVYRHVESVGPRWSTADRRAGPSRDAHQVQGLPMAFHARFDSGTEPITRFAQVQTWTLIATALRSPLIDAWDLGGLPRHLVRVGGPHPRRRRRNHQDGSRPRCPAAATPEARRRPDNSRVGTGQFGEGTSPPRSPARTRSRHTQGGLMPRTFVHPS